MQDIIGLDIGGTKCAIILGNHGSQYESSAVVEENINLLDIVEILGNRFGIRSKLQNNANACALAEWKFGAAKSYNNVVFLTFGTGMGARLILDGKLYSGTNDMAGEVGHIRLDDNGPVGYGKAGSFEGFCSGRGIAQLARMKVLEKLQRG